jgi:hypothetical protein
MRIFNFLLTILAINLGFGQNYFPKNDGVKQTYKNPVAITNATIYSSSTVKIENATLLFDGDKILEI